MSQTAIGRMRADLQTKQAEVERLHAKLSSLQDEVDRLGVALSVIEKYEAPIPVREPAPQIRAQGVQATILQILAEAGPQGMKRSEIVNRLKERLGRPVRGKSVSNALAILSRKEKVESVGRGMWRSAAASVDRTIDGLLGRMDPLKEALRPHSEHNAA